MKKKPNPELIDDDNPEWTAETTARALRFSESAFKPETQTARPASGRKTQDGHLIARAQRRLGALESDRPRLADADGEYLG